MNSSAITHFAKNIGSGSGISENNAKTILNKLQLKDLKVLLKELKKENTKNKVKVLSHGKLSAEAKKELENMFKTKTLYFLEDETIGAGIKIKTYDMIYDLSLNGQIQRLAEDLK